MPGIYIHIPFCKKACTYCDFHFSTSLKYADDMTDAICKELLIKKDRVAGEVGTIYFGGGTPSVLPLKQLQRIFDVILVNYNVAADAEVTLEANPDDLDAQKIAGLRQLPVNRFSIGIQSFFEEDLIWMNRAHNAMEAEDCIKRSQDAGFENLNADLIYGYPLLTDAKLLHNIAKLRELEIPHVSAYSLTVEPRTALAKAIEKGATVPVSDEQSASQFLTVIEKLGEAGLQQYEISNFARPGRYAVHNTNYWRGVPYLGIGPSAHGFDGKTRYLNIANNALYMKAINAGNLPETIEQLSIYDQFNEYMMTSLRTMWGTDLSHVNTAFGDQFYQDTLRTSEKFLRKGWLMQDNEVLRLSAEGKLFADHIASGFFLSPEDHC
ncbi:radical SAM family heme chaperone HemW [Pedobacter faecalis]|uniref:radical SAM family heme chaperone HemW n=1 Tax=Pedobacter faecalis TaxID=3041495 RepID=UPI00254E726C|nr:radical SAM family heme chaperone HemW [Pedobacter sp. ELA7]